MAAAVEPAPAQRGTSITPLRRNFNLARELAWTQFKLKYTGSVLGYLWSLVKPAMLFGMLYAIFVLAFRIKGQDFPLQLLVGIVFFTFFTDCTIAGMNAIIGSGHLIRKAYFPRSVLVVASSMTAAMTFTINFLLIIAVTTPLGLVHLGVRSLAVIPLIFELYLLAVGISLLLASLFVFYRDLGHIWDIFTQLLFYASAVVFPITFVPVRFTTIFFINPMAQIIEDVRHAIVTPEVPWTANVVSAAHNVTNPVTHAVTSVPDAQLGALALVPIVLSIVLFGVGLAVFQRLSPVFAEEL